MHENRPNTSKWNTWLPLLLALFLVIGMLIGMELQSVTPTVVLTDLSDNSNASFGQGKIEELIRYIEAKYVDEVNREELIQQAIDNILGTLDPHSNYISAEQLKDVNDQLEGNFDGIGVEFLIVEDTVVVVAALAGGPSEAVGILAGDKIVEVEGNPIAGKDKTNRDVVNLLKGEKGSSVKIGVIRGRDKYVQRFSIVRGEIPMHSVDIAYMVDEKTGYIKLNRFSATTYEEFMKGIEKMIEEDKMEDLIIDLRHNPGGYLKQATNILSQLFKEKEKLLVYTQGRTVKRDDYESTGRPFFDIGNITVLIDEGSASASEILAGAIQDQDRGVIIGRRSFGKGLVQEQYKLRDGSALRLTVARYYTPSGRSIQKPYDNLENYDNDMQERYESGELSSEDNIAIGDSTKYFTAKGNVVYGGGGIFPDIFVPIDTVLLNKTYSELRQHAPQFAFRYFEKHPELKDSALHDLNSFKNEYEVDDDLLKAFLDYTMNKGVKITDRQFKPIAREIKRLLKARLAKHRFGDEGFYSVWNDGDQMVRKALEVLQLSDPVTLTKEAKVK
ncbi:MAG: S41 family peptidase [Saprospiraceae bacterium]